MRRFAGMVLLSVALGLSASGQQTAEDQGAQALDQKNYTAAIEIFSELATDNPKNFFAWFNLALAESALGKDAESIEHYQRALEVKPDLYEARLNLGMMFMRDKRPADAAVQFAEACKLKEGQLQPRLYLAESQLAAHQYKDGATSFETAAKLDPKSAAVELGWGQCLLGLNEPDEAAPHYRRAAELDPALGPRQIELASAYADAHRPKDAIDILKWFPGEPGVNRKLAELYMAAGEPEQAVARYEALYQASPNAANGLALASAYIQSNQSKLAIPMLEKALAQNPNDYEVQLTAGQIYLSEREYPKAQQHFLAAAKLKPDLAKPWSDLAGAATLAEDYPQALDALEQLHRLQAETAGHFYLRAIILDKLGEKKPALANYLRFLELSEGKNPDEEFKARQRIRIIEHELGHQ